MWTAMALVVLAAVSILRDVDGDGTRAPLTVSDGLNAKSKAVPVSFRVPMEKLEPGRYTCQVSVLDPTAQKFAFWRSPMVVLGRQSEEQQRIEKIRRQKRRRSRRAKEKVLEMKHLQSRKKRDRVKPDLSEY
jgi:hypothetical protein